MLRSNMKKMILAGLVSGGLLLGNAGAQALVSLEGLYLPINGVNQGNSTQNSTWAGGEGGGGFLTLVGVGLLEAPLNILNTGDSCHAANADVACGEDAPELAPAG